MWAECDVLLTDARRQRILIPVRTYAIQGGGQRAGIWIRSPLCWYHIVSVHPDAQELLGDAIAAVSMLCRLFTAVHAVDSWPDDASFHRLVRTVFSPLTQCDPRWRPFCCEHALTLLSHCEHVHPFMHIFHSAAHLERILTAPPPSAATRATLLVASQQQHQHHVRRITSDAAPEVGDTWRRRIPEQLIESRTHLLNCVFCSGLYDKAHAPQWLDCLRRHVLAEELAVMREHARNLLRLRSIVASARVRAFVERELNPPQSSLDPLASLRSEIHTHQSLL